jgi:predicted Zn-dependent protease with MMP-like domain
MTKPDWPQLCALATKEIEAILARMPADLRESAATLPVTFEPRPNQGLQDDGIESDTLGLFTGAEYAEEGQIPMPPQIILFLENLWDMAEGVETVFLTEVGTTFLHELGHFLGLDEDDLVRRGLE